jgi:ubiquinone/menaquinone biosynthesis C-methylase UbiE
LRRVSWLAKASPRSDLKLDKQGALIDFGLQLYRKRLSELFEEFLTNSTILDVGCGDANLWTAYFSKAGRYVVGSDIQSSKIWKEVKTENVEIVMCDARHLPFKHHAFQVVFEKDVLHHVNDYEKAIYELFRVASRKLIIVEANRYNPVSFLHMTLWKKHEHFSRREFVRMISRAKAKTDKLTFLTRESHFYPFKYLFMYYLLYRLEDLVEKIPLMEKLRNYNIALVTRG